MVVWVLWIVAGVVGFLAGVGLVALLQSWDN